MKDKRDLLIASAIFVVLFCGLACFSSTLLAVVLWPRDLLTVVFPVVKGTPELLALQQQVEAKYPAHRVEASITRDVVLDVTLVDAHMDMQGLLERRSASREIATFAKSHYSDISKIETIVVSFGRDTGSGSYVIDDDQIFAYSLKDL